MTEATPPSSPPPTGDVNLMHAPIMRERAEPRDGYEPVPFWMAGVFGVLLFWGGWYLATYSGSFRADVLNENPQSVVGETGPGRTLSPVELGQRLYSAAACVSCHQSNGEGQAVAVPPLARSEWVNGPPQRLKRILLHGLTGPITVRGQSYNSDMPAIGAKLKDEQIAAILTYIRQEWGNSASPVPPESVTATRAATKGRTAPFTAAELLAIAADDYTAPTTEPATRPAP